MGRLPHTFIGEIEVGTAKAVLFRDHFWEEAHWLPRSHCTIDIHLWHGEARIEVADWLAGKKGLKEDA